MRSVRLPWLTSEAVISESCHLLSGLPHAVGQIEHYIRDGVLKLVQGDSETRLLSIFGLMRKYVDVPMSFADGSLVIASRDHLGLRILTLDSDFAIYRRTDGTPLPLLAPFQPSFPP